MGWLVGDGTIKTERAVLSFFGEEKQELAPMFAQYVETLLEPLTVGVRNYSVGVVNVKGRDEARVQSTRLRTMVAEYGLTENKFQVPEVVFQGTEDMQRGFLQALFTADGSVQQSKGATVVRLASSHLDLLYNVQLLLGNFGIASRIYKNRRGAQQKYMPDGKGGQKLYNVKPQHELQIGKSNVVTFGEEIGFLLHRKNQSLTDCLADYKVGTRSESFTAVVESVEYDGDEDVYDLTEPITHSFSANNFIIHNCGEQSLSAFAVCNLGALNLARFVDSDTGKVVWEELRQAVGYAVRFLDNVIDNTPYFFTDNEVQQKLERRVGLGIMGLAEMLIRCGVRYGSEESIRFLNQLFEFITVEAYLASSEIAAEKGSFPAFDAEKFLESGFMRQMPEHVRQAINKNGVRNVTLLTIAPTGTTGTMVNTSTGIEPFFSWVYYRKSRLGLHEEQVPLVKDWYAKNPNTKQLPDFFVTAMDLSPEEHVRVQGVIQRWIDSSISKTANLPNNYTMEQVSDLYKYMYELGCKGGTVYRDGSRDEQVLMLKGDERAESEMENVKGKKEKKSEKDEKPAHVATPHRVYPRPKKLTGVTVNCATPFGTAYVTMNTDEHGYPFEVFITAPGKAGSDLQADAEGLGRMISLSLRTTEPHNRKTMLQLIIDQLRDIGGARSVGFGQNRVVSLPDAVARALEENYFPKDELQQLGLPIPEITVHHVKSTADHDMSQGNGNGNGHHGVLNGADVCPSCANITLIRAEGCRKCLTCGYSEC